MKLKNRNGQNIERCETKTEEIRKEREEKRKPSAIKSKLKDA